MRLIRTRHFDAVFAARVRVTAGPLVVWAAPNDELHCRLGLAISRRAGSAAVRNRIRRLIRESFRLLQHDLPREPRGYDVVVSVRRHEPLSLQEYRAALGRAVETLNRRWHDKANNSRPDR
jgi:ribonuclease P protein component